MMESSPPTLTSGGAWLEQGLRGVEAGSGMHSLGCTERCMKHAGLRPSSLSSQVLRCGAVGDRDPG